MGLGVGLFFLVLMLDERAFRKNFSPERVNVYMRPTIEEKLA
jgi:hypothetical protein